MRKQILQTDDIEIAVVWSPPPAPAMTTQTGWVGSQGTNYT